MDSSKVTPEEIEKAKQMLEKHRNRSRDEISQIAMIFLGIAILGTIFFEGLVEVDKKIPPMLLAVGVPLGSVVFGIIGLFQSVSTKAKILSTISLLVGVLVLLFLSFVYVRH